MENKAVTHIFNDILSKVLELSENPSQFAEYLTKQIRELIGARTIVIAVKTEPGECHIFSVFPQRRTEWANQSEVLQLVDSCLAFDSVQYFIKSEDEEVSAKLLAQLDIDQAIAIPLIAANRHLGVILLLDIMDLFGIESIIDLLTKLSGVFALVIRNSFLYQNMEDLVTNRTQELQKRNAELEEAILRAEESEQTYRTLFESINDAVFISELSADAKSAFIEVNDVACQRLGYTREELLTIAPYDINSEKAKKNIPQIIREVLTTKQALTETEHVTKDGRIIPVEISSRVTQYKNKTVFHSIARDITERKKSEEALRESEEKFSMVFRDAPVLIAITDMNDATYLDVNEQALKISGFSRDEIIGHTASDIGWIRPEDRLLLKRIVSEKGKVTDLEMIFCTKDKRLIFGLVNAEQIIIGKRTCLLSVTVDISDRKIAEKSLKRSDAELKRAQQITHIGSFYVDLTTNQVSWTEELYKMYGFDPALPAPLLNNSQNLFTPESWDLLSKSIANTAETGVPYQIELKTIRKDGSNGWIWARGEANFDFLGKIIGLSGAVQDITEQKQIEDDLRKAKEHAEESDRLKSAFLANMSHEIRTPLNSIIGFSDLLNDPDFDQEQKSEFTKNIINNGNNLLVIINDIMDISRMESGHINIRKDQIKVQPFISFITDQYAFQATAKNIELKLSHPAADEEIIIFADTDRLSQIFNNLISNALKFTEHGRIELGYCPGNSMVEFYVRDTGIGISAEYHDKIFDRFRQVESEKTRKYGGNGLGLAITKKLVELMGGRIWLESEPGKGSAFHFTLPCGAVPGPVIFNR